MMRVVKRNGEYENVSFDKVLRRLQNLSDGIDVNVFEIAQKVCSRIFDGVKTSELDELAAQMCSSMMVDHPDYGKLAARIIVSNHHKNTSPSFSETIQLMYDNKDAEGNPCHLVSDELYEIVMSNKTKLNSYLDYSRDYNFDYFGFKTLERSYLTKVNGKIVERPQHMWMRVALGIHGYDFKDALQTYELMSTKHFTHATPTLFNAGTPRPQMSSCYLIAMESDSVTGIFNTLQECAHISKYAGGIGLHIHNIRAKGSRIRGTNGASTGIIPMLRVFNNTARFIDQAGKRLGSFAMYLEPWHADVENFIQLRKNHGNEEERCRDLFLALWISDLFMKRVKENGKWSLMCPDRCPGLSDAYGKEFEELYEKYEKEGRFVKQVNAQELWFAILECQIETGTPYILYKDAANKKSNQKNLGTIKSSNLCSEIVQFSSGDETAVCLTGDTEVMTDKGVRYIKDIKDEKVLSFFKNDTDFVKSQEFHHATLIDNGTKDVYAIDFSGTKSIKATANHKFLVKVGRNYDKKINKYEWKTVHEIQPNDQVALPTLDPLPGYDQVNIQLGANVDYAVVGWMLGDGWQVTSKNGNITYGVCFGENETYAQEVVINHLVQIHDKLEVAKNGHARKITTYIDKRSKVVSWTTSKRSFIKYFHDIYGVTPNLGKDKSIPKKIIEAEPHELASFLSGLFSADGSVYMNKAFYVQFSSASKILLENVQSVLRCFGIKSRYVWHYVAQRDRWQGSLTIYGMENIKRFKKYIGFTLCKEKEEQLLAGIKTHQDVYCTMEKDYAVVKNVTYVGQEQVYDLSLPESHNFIANGLVTHNCNLSSICLPTYVTKDENGQPFFDFNKLHEVTKTVTKNLNKVIDRNFYPTPKTYKSNMRHRPVGIGIQGLADTFVMLRMPFESNEARELNKHIFETIYHGALESSMEIAKKRHELVIEAREKGEDVMSSPYNDYLKLNEFEHGVVKTNHPGAYVTFEGSPASQGTLQFDMWDVTPSQRYNWDKLKQDIVTYGIRNSLLVAPMPTASTSQIMGFNESFEPFTTNIFKRKTLSGEFIVINKYLIQDLINLGLWDKNMKELLILNEGSVQNIDSIPADLKPLYKTVWEVKQRCCIDMSADRGAFVCQSQSLNIFMEEPDFKKLSSMHFYGWSKGLKTGSYYLRTKPRTKTQQFTIDPELAKKAAQKKAEIKCDDEEGVCMTCSA